MLTRLSAVIQLGKIVHENDNGDNENTLHVDDGPTDVLGDDQREAEPEPKSESTTESDILATWQIPEQKQKILNNAIP